MKAFWNYYNQLIKLIEQSTTQDWVVVCGIVLLVGIFCMRGFGSRAKY